MLRLVIQPEKILTRGSFARHMASLEFPLTLNQVLSGGPQAQYLPPRWIGYSKDQEVTMTSQLFFFRCTFRAALGLVLLPGMLMAQSGKGTLVGRVTDNAGAVLQGAQIELGPQASSAVSISIGEFTVAGLKPGSYKLTVKYVGFEPLTTNAVVSAGQTARVDAVLKVASKLEEVTVTADRALGEAEAINRERTADNILQVLPQEVITSLPNENVADAIGRLPSVTLERDEGEGKYVQIRGTEPRLSNLTIDGINVPSPESGVRQIKLDTIPADIIESVEINKTLQANQDGDGIGGSVNLKTKTAGDEPTISLTGLGGYTPIQSGRAMNQFAGTAGRRFGAGKRLGLLLGGTYDYNGRGIDDIEPVPDPTTLTPSYSSMDIREYRYNRYRWGIGGSADYKLGEASNVFIRGLYSDFKDYGDRWVYSLNAGDIPGYGTSSRRPDYTISNLVLGGHHVFSSSWLAWSASVARSRQLDSAGNPGADFNYIASAGSCSNVPATNPNLPQWSTGCFTEAYNPSNFTLAEIDTSHGQTAQLNLSGSASFAKNYHVGSHFATFEIGGKVRNAHKFDNSFSNAYVPNDTLPMTQFIGSFQNSNYYDGKYPFGPAADWSAITAYLNSNPGSFTPSLGFAYGNDGNFNLVERISAGYVMNTIDFGRFRLIAGVRLEGTQVSTRSFDDSTNTFSVFGNGSYLDALPSASLRMRLDQDSGIRVVYGRGLARPDPQDLTTAVSFDGVNTWSIGNPALKAEYANNYDLLYERYLKPMGMIQAGFFYKDLANPIIETTYKATSGPYDGSFVQQPANAGSAYVLGFEIAYIQHLGFLPGALHGLGISANYSYTASQASGLAGRSDHPALLRQAPNTWNISPTYDGARISSRLGLSYNGSSIFGYQYTDGTTLGPKGPGGDNYLYPHFQVDAQASVRLYRGLDMIVYGLNLTNEVFGFYNGSPQYVVQREYYKPTYALGFRWQSRKE